MMLLRLAYRNIWRNRRRTLITAASILFAIFFAIVMRSIQVGAWQKMVDSVVHFYYGYAQVQDSTYWEEQSIDNAILYDETLRQQLADVDGVRHLVPRLESFALASHVEQSRGVLLIGIDPALEDKLTGLSTRVDHGDYLTEEPGVLLGAGLAEYLNAQVGDTAVFISQGFRGTNAAGKYPVSGIVSFPTPEFDRQLAFLSLADAQWFYGADDRVTSLVVDPVDADDIKHVTRNIRERLDPSLYVVKDYEELIPELLEAKAFDEAGGIIVMLILYMIVGFGIFGTMLMMLKERQYEFGILKAIGLKNHQLQIMLWLESVILTLIGCAAGMVVSLPIVYYLQEHPIEFTGEMAEAYEKFGVEAIMPATLDPVIFLSQVGIVLLMISAMVLYPLIRVRTLEPVKAMRQ